MRRFLLFLRKKVRLEETDFLILFFRFAFSKDTVHLHITYTYGGVSRLFFLHIPWVL